MKQFDEFIGKRMVVKTPTTVYIGTLQDEDWQFVYLVNCKVKWERGRRLRPFVAIRKTHINELIVLDGDEQIPRR